MRRWWKAILVLLCAIGVFGPAAPAAAHAGLESSTPAASSVLEESPAEIVLDFDEAVESTLTRITLYDATARTVDVGAPEAVPGDDSVVTARLPDLDEGVYAVVWRTTSTDGHVVDGAFSFQIGTAAEGGGDDLLAQVATGGGASDTVTRLLSVARLLGYLAVAVLVGAGIWALLAPAHLASHRSTRAALWSGAGLLVVGSAAQYALQAAYAVAGTIGDAMSPEIWGRIDGTATGRTILLRLVLGVLALALVARWERRGTAWWRSAALAGALAAVVSIPAGGHASALSPRLVWIAVGALHLVAMAIWLGGLVLFTIGGRRWWCDEAVVPLVRRFSAASAVCVPVVVVTGVLQTREMAGGFGDITVTAWGRTLLAKAMVVVVLVVLGGVSRWVLRQVGVASVGRLVAVEAAIGIAVLALAAGMVGSSPRPAAAGQVFSTSLTNAGVIVDVTVTPGQVGANELHVIVTPPGGSLQPVAGVTARVALPERDLPDAPVAMAAEGPNHYSGSLTLAFSGTWTLELIVETAPGNNVLLVAQVPIP